MVDLDLEKFFDRVNHDKLMGQVAKRVEDKRLLKLIRAFLNAGVMEMGWSVRAWKELRKEVLFRPCSVTWYSTNWTGNWSDADTDLCATPMTTTST